MRWTKDLAAEELMDALGIKWEYKGHISVDKLRITESKMNNARFGDPVDPDHVMAMAQGMENGRSFPAIVCTKSLFIMGGNNRVDALCLVGEGFVDAYIVDGTTTKDQIDEFCRRDNRRHGKLNTEEENIQHCIELHIKYPKKYPLIRLRDEFLGKDNKKAYAKLTTAWQARSVSDSLTDEAVDPSRLTTGALAFLHPLRQNKKVLGCAARAATKSKLNDTQVREMVSGVTALNNEAEKIRHIGQYSKRQHGSREKRKESSEFRRKITQVYNALHNGGKPHTFKTLGIVDPDEIKEIKKTITTMVRMLRNLKKADS